MKDKIRTFVFNVRWLPVPFFRHGFAIKNTSYLELGKEEAGPVTLWYMIVFRLAFSVSYYDRKKAKLIIDSVTQKLDKLTTDPNKKAAKVLQLLKKK